MHGPRPLCLFAAQRLPAARMSLRSLVDGALWCWQQPSETELQLLAGLCAAPLRAHAMPGATRSLTLLHPMRSALLLFLPSEALFLLLSHAFFLMLSCARRTAAWRRPSACGSETLTRSLKVGAPSPCPACVLPAWHSLPCGCSLELMARLPVFFPSAVAAPGSHVLQLLSCALLSCKLLAAGQEECLICYSIIQPTNGQLPRLG